MLVRSHHLCLGILLGLTLTGCSSLFGQKGYFNQQKTAYLRSQSGTPIQLPGDVNSGAVGNDLVIPRAADVPVTQPIGIIPPDSLAEKIASGQVSKDVLKGGSQKLHAGVLKQTPQGDVMLQMDIPTTAIWSQLGSELSLAGYQVLEEDKNLGTVFILDVKSTDGKATKATPIYQMHFADNDEGAQITLTDNSGNRLPLPVTQRVLSNLNDAFAGKIKKPPFKLLPDKALKQLMKNLTGMG